MKDHKGREIFNSYKDEDKIKQIIESNELTEFLIGSKELEPMVRLQIETLFMVCYNRPVIPGREGTVKMIDKIHDWCEEITKLNG